MLLDIRKRLTIPIDIQETPRMTVLRAYSPLSNSSTDISSIYVFYDASTKAYNPVVYISKNNQISLVIPKKPSSFYQEYYTPQAKGVATRLAQFVI